MRFQQYQINNGHEVVLRTGKMSPSKCVGCRNQAIKEIMQIVWHPNQSKILRDNCDFPPICLLQTGFIPLIALSVAVDLTAEN
ncbi:unnamed protein product [Caenorhabditis brenneri]